MEQQTSQTLSQTDKNFQIIQKNNILNPGKNRKKSKKGIKIIFITLLTLNIIFIILIAFILYYFLKLKAKYDNLINNNASNNNYTERKETLVESKNLIDATYKIKKGESLSLFNPNELNLKEGDYSIEGKIESQNKKIFRHLRDIVVENGKYSPIESGYLTIKINFKYNLKSLDSFFKDCKDLIKVSLSDLEMEEVTSMNSTFSGCSNLNEINLEGINTENLMDMAYTFENCNELRNINLSPIKTFENTKIESIFSGCEKLEAINISSFDNMNESMFKGIKSKPNIIGNTYISTKVTQIFYNLFNININITIIKFNNTTKKFNKCIIGEKEKCKKCSKIIPENCLTCNDGYYLPFKEYENKVCLSCYSMIEHCNSCYGDKNFITCSSCEEEYYLENNKCFNQKNLCIIGENEKCKTCNDNPNLRNQCKTCNKGYYLPIENKNICESCEKIVNCAECAIENSTLSCYKCNDGFELKNNECIEEICTIGENEKCASCRKEKGRKKECYLCNDGFNISDSNPYICKSCSIKNCKKCSFRNGNEICLECNDTYVKIRNEEGYIGSCECPYGNISTDGLCINNGNWIELIAQNQGALVDIANFYHIDISPNDIDLYINGKLTQFSFSNKRIKLSFGNYERNNVKLKIKKNLTSMEGLFDWCHIVKSVTFLPGFDSTQVTSMKRMFYDTRAETIDLKNLELPNLLDIGACFDYIPYNFRISDKVPNSSIIDFSTIDTSKVTNCLGIFHIIFDTYTIKISNKFSKCKKFLPINNRVINIDDLACNKFDNCKKCEGSVETLHCIQCNIGYELIDNKCIKPKCILGEDEKCYTCNNKANNENECNECNDGYYLPLNSKNKTKCTKCPIDGCKKCDNEGICQKCMIDYEPSTIDGIIMSCTLKCELGKDDKCLACDEKVEIENVQVVILDINY